MACFHYVSSDGSEENFESEDTAIWRRFMLCGGDRPEPYQFVRVYEVTHLPELPPGFVLVRDYDQADELYLQASEARRKVHTGRKFRLLEAKWAQRVIQAMGCELIPELYALSKPQKAQMPPVSDSQSEDDVLPHPEPQEQQEPVASDRKFVHGVPITNKKLGVLAVSGDLKKSGKINDIPTKELTRFIAGIADKRFPDLAPFTPQDVNNALKKHPEFEPYLARRGNSVKAIPSSGDNRNHLLDGSCIRDNGEQSAIDDRLDKEAKLGNREAECQKWIKISNRDSKKGN